MIMSASYLMDQIQIRVPGLTPKRMLIGLVILNEIRGLLVAGAVVQGVM